MPSTEQSAQKAKIGALAAPVKGQIFLLAALVLALIVPGLTNLPVIDRDEARYMQATVQMIETGDYVNIHFQDRDRNKKPAGAYWAQAVSAKTSSNLDERRRWSHRLPSLLAALISVIATYFAGLAILGKKEAMIAAGLLATSMMVVFEGHVAKTDALLLASVSAMVAAICVLRTGPSRRAAFIFWAAFGASILIKGPMGPAYVFLSLAVLVGWERWRGTRVSSWLRGLINIPALLLGAAIALPWYFLIWRESGGAFFTDAFGGDLAPKLKGGQESHGAPPGTYSGFIWATIWPASLFLLPALVWAVAAARGEMVSDSKSDKPGAARMLLAFTIPFFILLECVPTKLPHYNLPIFPALCLMMAAAISYLPTGRGMKLRKVGVVIFVGVSAALLAALCVAPHLYGAPRIWPIPLLVLGFVFALLAARWAWRGAYLEAFIPVIFAALLYNFSAYHAILPSLTKLRIADQVETILSNAQVALPVKRPVQILSPHFTEPSLVFHLGTDISLGEPDAQLASAKPRAGDVLILDIGRADGPATLQSWQAKLSKTGDCLDNLGEAAGTNYAGGDEVRLQVMRVRACG